MAADPLETLLRNAVLASGAEAGWVLARTGAELQLVAYCGPDDPARFLGAGYGLEQAGSAGMAAMSNQPMAIRPRPDDAVLTRGVMGMLERAPTSYLTIPCADEDGVSGVIEVIDKRTGAGFDIDDIELLSLLSDIAGALLAERAAVGPPAEVDAIDADEAQSAVRALAELAASRPELYRALLTVITATRPR